MVCFRNTKEDDKTLWVIKRLSLCFVVFSFVELIKTLGCRLLSLRVNAESLFDLLKVCCCDETFIVMSHCTDTQPAQNQFLLLVERYHQNPAEQRSRYNTYM